MRLLRRREGVVEGRIIDLGTTFSAIPKADVTFSFSEDPPSDDPADASDGNRLRSDVDDGPTLGLARGGSDCERLSSIRICQGNCSSSVVQSSQQNQK